MEDVCRKEIDSQLMYLPFWLDIEKDVQNCKRIYKANRILASLFIDEILNEEEIDFIMQRFYRAVSNITDYNTVILRDYYEITFDEIMAIVIDNEEYVSAHHLKEVKDKYFDIIFK
jgi:hypothetical protein